MTIIAPPAHGQNSATQLSRMLQNLDPQPQATLRRLNHVLRPPIDAPRVIEVINSAGRCITAYKNTLTYPNDAINQLVSEIGQLIEAINLCTQIFDIRHAHEKPLYRRLTRYPGWALCIAITDYPENQLFVEAAGVEIALSLATEKTFPDGYGNDIRRTLENRTISIDKSQISELSFSRHFQKAKNDASILFENVPTSWAANNLGAGRQLNFDLEAKQQLLQKRKYALAQHRAGVLNRHCQSKAQVIQSARELRQNAEEGDETSILVIVAFCAGLSCNITAAMPLVHQVKDGWIMTIDIHAGCIKTNIAPMLPDAAVPAENSEENYCPASKIIVKPLPQFIATKLAQLFASTPYATIIGELIPDAIKSGSTLTIAGSHCGISPSVSKFLNSAAPFALQIGIGRLAVAAISNDFSVIPSAKFYYAQIERDEIWEASEVLFEGIGWGATTAIQHGVAAGSEIVVTRTSVANLYQWMAGEISVAQPGRHSSLQKLVAYHNVFAKFCATVSIFMLGWRDAHELAITPKHLQAVADYAPVFDKRTGQFHGALPVPANQILKDQIQLYRVHCIALHNRLVTIGGADTRKLRGYLKKLTEISSRKLFFQINDKYQLEPIGSSDLTTWWPEHLRFPANFSRSFWHSELHMSGLNSSLIDLFMRHQLPGSESHTSSSHLSLKQQLDELCIAQENILNEMGIIPFSGLAKK